MSITNYDSSAVGVPYVRVNNVTIQYPPNHLPVVTCEQVKAVKMADGSIVEIGPIQGISFSLDLVANATTPIPIVDPTTGSSLGANTNLQQILLSILGVIRQQQLIQNP